MKKEWKKPQMVVVFRGSTEENVFSACKGPNIVGSIEDVFWGCYTPVCVGMIACEGIDVS
jgi:hypothetical protein